MFWIAASFCAFPIVFVVELFNLLPIGIETTKLAYWALAVWFLVVVAATSNAMLLRVTKIQVEAPSDLKGTILVQLSDLHIGSRSTYFLKRVVRKVIELKPDFLAITGDLVDSRKNSKEDLAVLQEVDAIKFFTIGNHERYEDLEAIDRWMRELDFIVLRNESWSTDSVQFVGIDDYENPSHLAEALGSVQLDLSKFKVLLFHRPTGIKHAVQKGFDLMLCGHTHNGQIFPFNYVVKRMFKRIKGDYQIDGMHLHVSSGTGTWGPVMRLGSHNEVALLEFV